MATRLTRRHLDQHNGILAVGFSTSLLTRRRPGYSDGDPVFPTATRFSRPRPGYPDGDPADLSASQPAQRHPGCATVFPQRSCPRHDDGVLAVFRPCRPCRQCPGVRLCPRHTGRVPAVPTVSWCVSSKWVTLSFVSSGNKKIRQVLFSSSSDPRSLHCYQSWTRAPIVTN